MYHEVHVRDHGDAKIGRLLGPAADFIASGLATGRSVLVHCKAGMCRSPTIVAAFFLAHRRDTLRREREPASDAEDTSLVRDAIAQVRAARSCANPRPHFVEALERFDEQMRWQPAVLPQPARDCKPSAADEESSDDTAEDTASLHNLVGLSLTDAAPAAPAATQLRALPSPPPPRISMCAMTNVSPAGPRPVARSRAAMTRQYMCM